jgi:hypothetical protein
MDQDVYSGYICKYIILSIAVAVGGGSGSSSRRRGSRNSMMSSNDGGGSSRRIDYLSNMGQKCYGLS